jgi:hypothetical protein
VTGEDKALPQPTNTSYEMKYDRRIEVPAYCIGERYKSHDDLLYVETREPVIGAECVLMAYGGLISRKSDERKYVAPGYKGEPPKFMVGSLVDATRTRWIVKTAAPHEYTWSLPRRGWELLGRVVGYRRGRKFMRTDH